MSENHGFGCDLHVDADVSEEALASDLAQLLGCATSETFMDSEEGYVSVTENDEFDKEMRKDALDGFLYYRFRVEIEPKAELGQENAVALVSKLLEHLWSKNYPAVASCGYEDELPYNGGYKSIYTPAVA